jgi:hypothetical protein
MSVRMVRVKIQPGKVAEVETKAKDLFAALEATQPEGVKYATCKLQDGETLVALLELEDDTNNPLFAIPAFREFQQNLESWVAGPPTIEELTPLGSYRLL